MNWQSRAKNLARLGFPLLAALAMTQCVLYRGVTVSYQPPLQMPREIDQKFPPVSVTVLDDRPNDIVGYSLGFLGEKEGEIRSGEEARDAVQRAFEIELRNQGFTIGSGGNSVVVVLGFFKAQFIHPLFHTKTVASIGLDVTVRRRDGAVTYAGVVLGENERPAEIHFESTDTWISASLNAAMSLGVDKAFADPLFLEALKRK